MVVFVICFLSSIFSALLYDLWTHFPSVLYGCAEWDGWFIFLFDLIFHICLAISIFFVIFHHTHYIVCILSNIGKIKKKTNEKKWKGEHEMKGSQQCEIGVCFTFSFYVHCLFFSINISYSEEPKNTIKIKLLEFYCAMPCMSWLVCQTYTTHIHIQYVYTWRFFSFFIFCHSKWYRIVSNK